MARIGALVEAEIGLQRFRTFPGRLVYWIPWVIGSAASAIALWQWRYAKEGLHVSVVLGVLLHILIAWRVSTYEASLRCVFEGVTTGDLIRHALATGKVTPEVFRELRRRTRREDQQALAFLKGDPWESVEPGELSKKLKLVYYHKLAEEYRWTKVGDTSLWTYVLPIAILLLATLEFFESGTGSRLTPASAGIMLLFVTVASLQIRYQPDGLPDLSKVTENELLGLTVYGSDDSSEDAREWLAMRLAPNDPLRHRLGLGRNPECEGQGSGSIA